MKTHLDRGMKTACGVAAGYARRRSPWLKGDLLLTPNPARVTCKACQNTSTFKIYRDGWKASRPKRAVRVVTVPDRFGGLVVLPVAGWVNLHDGDVLLTLALKA